MVVVGPPFPTNTPGASSSSAIKATVPLSLMATAVSNALNPLPETAIVWLGPPVPVNTPVPPVPREAKNATVPAELIEGEVADCPLVKPMK